MHNDSANPAPWWQDLNLWLRVAKYTAVGGISVSLLRASFHHASRELLLQNGKMSGLTEVKLSEFESTCIYNNLTTLGAWTYRCTGGLWTRVPPSLRGLTSWIPVSSEMKDTPKCKDLAQFLITSLAVPNSPPNVWQCGIHVLKMTRDFCIVFGNVLLTLPGYTIERNLQELKSVGASAKYLLYFVGFLVVVSKLGSGIPNWGPIWTITRWLIGNCYPLNLLRYLVIPFNSIKSFLSMILA